jgi:hypothetical protein
MSDATDIQLDEVDNVSANMPDSESVQSGVSPTFELPPFVDTRTDEQKAADERLKKQMEEYHMLYERGDIGETSLNSLILHRLAGRFSVIRELQRAFTGEILRLMKPESECGQGLTLEDAIKRAESYLAETTAEKLFNDLKYRSVNNIDWFDMRQLFKLEPAAAEAIWKRLKTEAREDFESGSFAAKIFETTAWRRDPWRRAQYVGICDAFVDDYKPRGAIELSMIEMAVTSFFMYYYWTEILMRRSDTEAMPELFTYAERRKMERYEGRYEWVPPRVTDQDAIEHAAQMADRFRRQYLSALRALRDYRRWGAPVIINNEGQVNFAANGGQQVNLQNKQSKKRRKKVAGTAGRLNRKTVTKTPPKQLGKESPEESIRMESASESVQVGQ